MINFGAATLRIHTQTKLLKFLRLKLNKSTFQNRLLLSQRARLFSLVVSVRPRMYIYRI